MLQREINKINPLLQVKWEFSILSSSSSFSFFANHLLCIIASVTIKEVYTNFIVPTKILKDCADGSLGKKKVALYWRIADSKKNCQWFRNFLNSVCGLYFVIASPHDYQVSIEKWWFWSFFFFPLVSATLSHRGAMLLMVWKSPPVACADPLWTISNSSCSSE